MTSALRAVFKLRPGEGRRVLQFVALFFLLQAGLAIGITTSDTLFLSNVGQDHLPRVYVMILPVMLLYIPLSSFLTARLGINAFFRLALFTVAGGGILIWVLLRLFEAPEFQIPIYYGAKIFSVVVFIANYSLLWNFTYQYFDILDGKRLFALFTAGTAVGAIVGGSVVTLLTTLLTEVFPVSTLYLVWSGLFLGAIPFFQRILKKQKIIETEVADEPEEIGAIAQTVRLARIIRGSRYVLLSLAVLFMAQILTSFCEFQYYDIFSTKYPEEADLAALIGKLVMGVNLFNLIISLFVFNRMVHRFGVRNVALILPIVYTAVFSWMFFSHGGFAAGLFGFFAYQGLMASIDYDNTNLLLNALPSEAKTQVRTFIEGLAEPLATAAVGIFLLTYGSSSADQAAPAEGPAIAAIESDAGAPDRYTAEDRRSISRFGIGGGLFFLTLVLLLRHQYVGAMITNLRKRWLDFSRNSDDIVSELEPGEFEFLSAQATSRDPHRAPTAIRILRLHDQNAAADALLDFMSHVKPEDRAGAEPLFAELLKLEDTELFRRILDWLERDYARIDIGLIQEISNSGLPQSKYLARLMKSPGPQEQATAALQLMKSWKLEDRTRGLETFERLFAQSEGGLAAGIHAIGRTGDERIAHFVAPWLEDPDPEVREEALLAINRLVNRDSGRLLPMILDVIRNSSSESRFRAMDALTRIGDTDCISPLLMLAGRFTAIERRKATAVVESVGLRGVPVAVSVLRGRMYPFRGRTIAARFLGNAAFAQYEDLYPELIPPELELAYRSLYRFEVLKQIDDHRPGLEVLRRLFLDVRMNVVEFVLELLSIGGRVPDIELIKASLGSNNPKERGNAIETIEQGVSRKLFQMLLPLIDSRPVEDRIAFYLNNFNLPHLSSEEIVGDSLNSNFPMGYTAAAHALWEMDAWGNVGRLRSKLETAEWPDYRKVLLSLLGVETRGLNLIERIHHLLQSPLFQPFGVLALELIAREAVEERFVKGERVFRKGDPADDLFYLIEGKVHHAGRKEELIRPGEVFGEECLFGEKRREDAVSEMAYTLRIPRATVFRNVAVYPHTALQILAFSRHQP